MKSTPRIIYINAHDNEFLMRNLIRIMTNNKVKSFKHQFIIDYLLTKGYTVYNLLIRQKNMFERTLPMKSYIVRCFDSWYVERVNKRKHMPILTLKDIRPTDIVIGYLVYPYQLEVLKHCNCYKVLFGNHFISISEPVSLKESGVHLFANEIDLTTNDFVKKYMDVKGVKPLLVPYIYADRFHVAKPFSERENKAMAIGTSSSAKNVRGYDLYKQMFHTHLIQPMRQEIYEKKETLTDWLDSYISYILEDEKKVKESKPLKWYNCFFPVNNAATQSSYTKFDMVETFNKYKMFVCPEELVGMPGIGFVEGMACGCAYLGLDHEMYTCLGLKPGYHYITYDGTLKDMERVVRKYQAMPEDLEKIAKQGCEFVREHFNTKVVAEKFEEQLLEGYNEYTKNLKI